MGSSSSLLEERIAGMAAGQHGVVARSQLMELGMSSSAIGRGLAAGRLRPVHRGVYLLGRIELARTREMAAVLAGGPTAAVSHTSGGCLLGLLRIEPPRPVHVTIPGAGDAEDPASRPTAPAPSPIASARWSTGFR